ncbi:RcnB family protein [Altericroceibacterium xinjiangense]|uniref:RcnB family protein n=1 Tax=Altericroceibacterium xinjiangense TaxID=762261 RepID=UPI0013DF5E50|nr:RcnB family protein [Altericroceibacterium xinjiangense]
MRFGELMKSGGFAALTVALAAIALPAQAAEPQRGWGSSVREAARDDQQASKPARVIDHRQQRSQPRQTRNDARAEARQAQGRDARAAEAPRYRQADRGQQRDWRNSDRTGQSWSTERNRAQNDPNWRDDDRRGSRDARNDYRRDRDGSRDWRNDRGDRDGYRDWRNDGRGDRYDQARRDYRQWDRRWRNNNRYDWQRYRARNRVTFSIGTYYAPYQNYYYRPFGVGGHLDSLFYSDRYWINDPWRYRLPDAYGPYRWVRYYDDALLVDVYNGQVVDAIRNFFW